MSDSAKWRPQLATPSVDLGIAQLASRQFGVVALGQLVELGLSPRAVRNRVAQGRLHRIHRGVYAVGHALLTRDGQQMAAVLACGPEAVLAYRSAGQRYGIRPDSRRVIDVSVPRWAARDRTGIKVHL